jgi:phage tail-like protein
MSKPYYPPGAFHFTVKILGAGALSAALGGSDASFSEISGMDVSWETEDVSEGGENRFVHRLPTRAKYANLVMKRGVVTESSFFTEWAGLSLGSKLSLPLTTQNILVMLLNDSGIPLIAWVFINAYPIKCSVGPLDSMENKILVETLELSYNYFERLTLGSPAAAAAQIVRMVARYS